MFERYNEDARRALFFSRYEATRLGAGAISPSHLAAGVLRATSVDIWAAIGGAQSLEHVREFLNRGTPATIVPPKVEIPFTTETKVALTRAAEIADEHHHRVISPMHLLAGVMADERNDAARILRQAGLDLQKVAAAGASDETLPRVTAHLTHVEARVDVPPAGPPRDPQDFARQALLRLLDERALERLCNELFAATDRKDWNAARDVFADGPILVDMTSLAGGAPAYMAADDLIGGFRQGLHRHKASHHLTSNYRVAFTSDGAEIFAHGYAWNRVDALAPNSLWETWGTYRFTAQRTADGWRLSSIQYVSTLTRGNDAVRTHQE